MTCLTLKFRSLENMPSAELPVLQLLTALSPKRFAFLCIKSPLHFHQRLQLLLVKCKVHSLFIVLMRNGSTESCGLLKINFACCNKMNEGSPCMPLTQPQKPKNTSHRWSWQLHVQTCQVTPLHFAGVTRISGLFHAHP